MNAVDFHSDIAKAFGERYQRSPDFQERFNVWSTLLDTYIQPGSNVLDAGCGTGVFSIYAAQLGATVLAIDGSEAMVDLTRRAAVQHQVVIQASVDWLPLTTNLGPFDAVLSSSVLEYVPDLSAALASLLGQVRSGGLLVVSMPNQRSVYRVIEQISYQLTRQPVYVKHMRHRATALSLHDQLGTDAAELITHLTYGGTNTIARLLRSCLPASYADTLFVAVFRKK
ncbi:MAG: class I SAM-dependent methyltransferase [Cytophagaceae bacterium]|nr:MAG: class I SAM-dependent methyltransferase [Cytophagaceae bacterium]